MRATSKSMQSNGLMLIYLLLLFGFGMIFLSGCSNGQSIAGQDPQKPNSSQAQNVNQTATTVIPDTAKVSTNDLDAAMQANQGWQLIDVREPREFAAGHIKMAINRPLGDDFKSNLNQVSKDKEIVLIDLNGSRSESAWQILVENGYDKNKVKVLSGGMLYWNGIISSAGSSSVNNSSSANAPASGNNAAAPKPEVTGVVGGC